MSKESEFFVGYLPVPPGIKKAVRRTVIALGLLVVAAAAILIAGQNPFPESTFEFQRYREFRGTLITEPYPALAIAGQSLPWLLAGRGKHGVGDLHDLNGREVKLTGERIARGPDQMIEVAGALTVIGDGALRPAGIPLGEVELTGEVVDSKCYFGVMNPGNGKVHRDCAARCISGGLPAAFVVRDASGRSETLLLADIRPGLIEHVGEPVTIHGRLVRSNGRLILYAE